MSSAFIMESAIVFGEAEDVKEKRGKVHFKNIIQTCDDVNQNKRLYPKLVLEQGMNDCKPRLTRNAFYGELDHPFPTGNPTFDQVRQTTVSLKEVSHLIRDYEFRGNHLFGEMETTSTRNGGILNGLLRDRSGLGFSMRGMAQLERLPTHNLVKGPLVIISFDAVSQPSHQSAVVDFNTMRFEASMITENSGLVCTNGKCFLPNYFDKLIETKVIQFFERWV